MHACLTASFASFARAGCWTSVHVGPSTHGTSSFRRKGRATPRCCAHARPYDSFRSGECSTAGPTPVIRCCTLDGFSTAPLHACSVTVMHGLGKLGIHSLQSAALLSIGFGGGCASSSITGWHSAFTAGSTLAASSSKCTRSTGCSSVRYARSCIARST